MYRKQSRLLTVVCSLFCVGELALAGAQQIPPSQTAATEGANSEVSSQLVSIPVSVIDHKDHPVTGIAAQRFHIFENGRQEQITHIWDGSTPLSIGILYDGRKIAGNSLRDAKSAVKCLLAAAHPQDEFFIVSVGVTPRLEVPFTSSAKEIEAGLEVRPGFRDAALIDAVSLAEQTMRTATNARRALLIISDETDYYDPYTKAQLQLATAETNVPIFVINVDRPDPAFADDVDVAVDDHHLIADIAATTGGRFFDIPSPQDLPAAIRNVNAELRNLYVVAYVASDRDRDHRDVRVTIDQAHKLRMVYRTNYIGG